MSGHTLGRWLRCNGTDIFADSDINAEAQIADCCFESTTNPASTEAANATRIVTCVNACDGIPNAALDAGVIGKLVEEAVVAVEELDYLVGFVRRQCEFEGDIDAVMLAVKSLRAALALVKGEQS